jgi:aryl-alcohol dehydrogenase-like predicted oxidoreductase
MKTFDRRWLSGGAGYRFANRGRKYGMVETPRIVRKVGEMPYRDFGKTGLQVSEVSFGAWGIGGKSYGAVDRGDALSALARAEELGCNLVDTAGVYGDSEHVLGEFLTGRRDQWIVATKYSGQEGGMTAMLESQLRRLRTDHVDVYMVHWMPRGKDAGLLRELEDLKRAGKTRFTGLSLYNNADVDDALRATPVDALMLPFSLLDPDPFLARRERLAASGRAVMIRSVLKEGFLTGKFTRESVFTDANDQRSQLTREQIAKRVEQVERLRFLEAASGSLLRAAIAYPLSFPEVSTTVLGARRLRDADENFGSAAGGRLPAKDLERIAQLQREMGLHSPGWFRKILARLT